METDSAVELQLRAHTNWIAMFGETFWSNALANLFATIIGIIIGLPLALWMDRIVRTRNEREKSREAEQRAGKILTSFQ